MTVHNQTFIEQFIQELLAKAWFTEADDLAQLTNDIKPLILDTITLSLIKEMSEQQRDQFSAYYKAGKIEEMQAYAQSVLPKYQEIVFEACAWFEVEYLSSFEE